MKDAIITSIALHRETVFIKKKKHDIQELTKLFKLTKDRYYQQQINRAKHIKQKSKPLILRVCD